jgi:hypothetical protein
LAGLSATRIFTKIDRGDSTPTPTGRHRPLLRRNSSNVIGPAVTADVIYRAVIDPSAMRYYSGP